MVKFLKHIGQANDFNNFKRIKDNLYLLKVPNIRRDLNAEMENLFSEEFLKSEFHGKKLSLSGTIDKSKHIGKHIFSKYVYDNYEKIDFSNFIPLLKSINDIIEDYEYIYSEF